jgi:hypothetical protein
MFDEWETEEESFLEPTELDHVRQMFEEIRESFLSADEKLEAVAAGLDEVQRLVRKLIDGR